MSKYLWLFDPGHGGIVAGNYLTAGRRSPQWEDNFPQLFEGEFNRSIMRRLNEMCHYAGIEYVNIVSEDDDTALVMRVKRANDIYINKTNCIYLSIHSNSGGGSGFEVWTSKGDTGSDMFADVFYNNFMNTFAFDKNIKYRVDFSDGDADKESNFYVLRNTKMPAVLTESLFMDNPYECKKYLLTREGRDLIAEAHFRAIVEIELGL